jgi:hypothetical protein
VLEHEVAVDKVERLAAAVCERALARNEAAVVEVIVHVAGLRDHPL